MPKPGFKQITVSDALYDRVQGIARGEGLSMPDLIRKMLGALYPEHPVPEGTEEREK